MANNFIQETVSREILVAQKNASIVRQFCATQFEGDIQGVGTSVKVNTLVPATLKDTKTNPVNRQADALESTAQIVKIETDKNYKFEIDHKDIAEGMPEGMFAETLIDIGRQIARQADNLVLSHYTEVPASNIISDVSLDNSNIYDQLIDIDVAMDEREMPVEGRIIFLTPKIAGLLAKDPLVRQAKEQDTPLGYVTKVGNLTIIKTNDIAVRIDETDPTKQWFECLAVIAGKSLAHVNGFVENKIVDNSVITEGYQDIAMGRITSGAKLIMPQYTLLLEVKKA